MFVFFDEYGEIQGASNGLSSADSGGYLEVESATRVHPATHYVSSGTLRTYTAEQAAAKAEQPHLRTRWSNASMRWIDLRNLGSRRDAAWEAIKNVRQQLIDTPILATPFGEIDVDPKSVDNLAKALRGWDEAARLASAPDTINWTMADNSAAALTRDQLGSVAALLLARGNAAFDVARTLRAAIYASDEPEEITWPADGT